MTCVRVIPLGRRVVSTPLIMIVALNAGQSLDVRRNFGLVSDVTTPVKGLMPNGGPQSGDQPDWASAHVVQSASNFESLQQYDNGSDGEGWGLGTIAQHAADENVVAVAHYASAVGGSDWEQTGPGSGVWGTGLRFLQACCNYADTHGLKIRLYIRRSQGEADSDTLAQGGGTSEAPVTQAQWEAGTREFTNTWTDDWNIICDGKHPAPVFTDSILNSAGAYGIGGLAVNDAQFNMMKEGVARFAPARYQFADMWEGDLIHPTPLQYRLHAECVSILEKDAAKGVSFQPLHVTQSAKNGATIDLTLSEPAELDIEQVTPPVVYPLGKHGVHAYNAADVEVEVSSAVLLDELTLRVTCAADPGGSAYVRIAQQDPAVATRPVTYLQRSNFRALKTLGTSLHLVDGAPFVFRNYMMQQKVSL